MCEVNPFQVMNRHELSTYNYTQFILCDSVVIKLKHIEMLIKQQLDETKAKKKKRVKIAWITQVNSAMRHYDIDILNVSVHGKRKRARGNVIIVSHVHNTIDASKHTTTDYKIAWCSCVYLARWQICKDIRCRKVCVRAV